MKKRILLIAVFVIFATVAILAYTQIDNILGVIYSFKYSNDEIESMIEENNDSLKKDLEEVIGHSIREFTEEETKQISDGTATKEEIIQKIMYEELQKIVESDSTENSSVNHPESQANDNGQKGNNSVDNRDVIKKSDYSIDTKNVENLTDSFGNTYDSNNSKPTKASIDEVDSGINKTTKPATITRISEISGVAEVTFKTNSYSAPKSVDTSVNKEVIINRTELPEASGNKELLSTTEVPNKTDTSDDLEKQNPQTLQTTKSSAENTVLSNTLMEPKTSKLPELPQTPEYNDSQNNTVGSNDAETDNTTSDSSVDTNNSSSYYLMELYNLKSEYLGKLDGMVSAAINEYKALDKKDRTRAKQLEIGASYVNKASSLEGQCDGEFSAIVKQIEHELKKEGKSTNIISSIKNTYSTEKQLKRAYYLNMLK